MKTMTVAIAILFDPQEKLYTVVRSDHLHPEPQFRYKIKGIGGIVEENENPAAAALRELNEEFPDVWKSLIKTNLPMAHFIPHTAKTNGGISHNKKGEEIQWYWQSYVFSAKLDRQTYYLARARSTESNIELYSLNELPKEEDCLPGFYQLLQESMFYMQDMLDTFQNPNR